jgi:hypothetical protein
MAVVKEKVMAMAMENAMPPPSQDLVLTALVLAAEALATLEAVTAAAMVLAAEAEAPAALKADDANGGNGSVAIIGSVSLAAGGGIINLFHHLFAVHIITFTSTRNKHSDSLWCEPITPLFRDQKLSHNPRLCQQTKLILGPRTNKLHAQTQISVCVTQTQN